MLIIHHYKLCHTAEYCLSYMANQINQYNEIFMEHIWTQMIFAVGTLFVSIFMTLQSMNLTPQIHPSQFYCSRCIIIHMGVLRNTYQMS